MDQKVLVRVVTKVVQYQQETLFGDDLPKGMVSDLCNRCKQALYICPLINLESIVMLFAAVN
jgi:hypothetical protein